MTSQPLAIHYVVLPPLSSKLLPLSCTSVHYDRYFFFGFIFSLVTTFIIVTILGAVDFWVVKNVTGRLLVGLRWWSDFDERGKEIWRF
jgi:hypothetical protein